MFSRRKLLTAAIDWFSFPLNPPPV